MLWEEICSLTQKGCRMWRAGLVASVLVLGSAWTLPVVPVLPEPVIQTQENFDLGRVSV